MTPSGSIPAEAIAFTDASRGQIAFMLTLRDGGVGFAAVGLPEANDPTMGAMALAGC
jgi:hypothetical protein